MSARVLRLERCTAPAKSTQLVCRTQSSLPSKRRQHTHHSPRRRLHSTSHHGNAATLPIATPSPVTTTATEASAPSITTVAPLGNLPLNQVLRTWLITSISSNPALMGASTKMLQAMLNSKNPVLDVEKNPLMRAILMETFYKQFCIGSNKEEITRNVAAVQQQGYGGVILEYALEVLADAKSDEAADIAKWRQAMLDTVDITAPGSYFAFKWSGLGPAAMRRMKNEEEPSKEMAEAMHTVTQAALAKDVALLPAAEETWTLNGFHKWSLDLMREYNTKGKAVVFSTYQAYLKQNTDHLARHMEMAKAENFTLGVKLVRGAYMHSEKRDLIWPTIDATHHAYDTVTSAMVHRQYNDLLRPSGKDTAFPDVELVVASHNAATVQKAQAWRQAQATRGEDLTPLVYVQLQGMADEVSATLVVNAKANEGKANAVQEKVYKYCNWGTMKECLNYLIRRAAENKDAAGRTNDTRLAMQSELTRRFKAGVGLS
ncbi:Proline dehydrogenase 1, mitochondrial [Fulvia fulva]|nr:Proline dehydrogenase 1, mitochondrial [Fulvia fulva]WPV14252.1 Proline dehydrogenase 1, mitochondrial [Fulvia fulva]WPV28388.1 Proline dehydrogenase 1, mitochondrial [Fulvia fulva]